MSECIESVLAQTYSNWDFTIVDNCSTDRTLEIACEYADKDPRIRIQRNESFVRVIENYNNAFRKISSESKYCKPLAADDMLLPECIEKMVQVAEENPRVAIVGAYGLYSRAEMGVYGRGIPYPVSVVSGPELCRAYLLGKPPSVFGAATFSLFRSDIIRSRHPFYNEDNLHADSEICLALLEHYDFGFVQQILTLMRVEEGSLTSFSQRVNTNLAYRLYALVEYGPKYLTEAMLSERIDAHLQYYYRYLGRQTFKRRGSQFWKFHRSKLIGLGYPLSTARVAFYALLHLLDLSLNPKQTFEKIIRSVVSKQLKSRGA
ncbi:MAG: glycosyltransferase family 2 protein [Nitrososphaera sp.]|nr:glycosyltransferase family 2 protein [Nitrososphaera sp.]